VLESLPSTTAYRNGFPVRLPQDVLNLAKIVESDLKLEENTTKKIEYFTVFGFDVFNAGSTTYRTGALVGLPLNFSYKSSDDIDKKNIMVIDRISGSFFISKLTIFIRITH
jgi:hypothetical protein